MKSLLAAVIVVWLLIGGLAAAQRGYFSGKKSNCAALSTTALTIVSGPLNYFGVNPKVSCKQVQKNLPQPSS